MFSFWPQVLIILSLTGIIVILLRKVPGVESSKARFIFQKIFEFLKKGWRELWHFILEVKGLSKSSVFTPQNFFEKFRQARINFPKPKLTFFHSTDSAEYYVAEGQKSLEKEDYAEAERKFIKAVEKDAKNEAAYSSLGKLYLIQKKFDEAVQTYKFLLKHYPENDTYWANLGQSYHGNKLYEQAIEAYEKAIELVPDNARRYVNLGLTLEAKKHIEEAILNYRKALDLEKSNTQFMLALAEALTKKGEKDEAQMLLEQVLQAEPTNHLARERLMQLKF